MASIGWWSHACQQLLNTTILFAKTKQATWVNNHYSKKLFTCVAT